MKYYKLRVDICDVGIDVVKTVLSRRIESSWMYAIEDVDGENPHMHWYIELMEDKVSRSLRQDLRNLGLKGNSSYSLKDLDERYPIEYLSYIMKDGRYEYKDIPQTVIDDCIAHNTKIKNEIKEKKASRKTQLQKCMEAFDRYMLDNGIGPKCQESTVYDFCMDYLLTGETLVREFQIISITQTMLLKYSPSYKGKFSDRIRTKIF